MMASKRAAGATVLLTVVALSGCSSTIPGSPASSAPKAERGLEKFYNQKIDWGSCTAIAKADGVDDYDPSMQCGKVTVPVDYNDIGAGEVKLAVARTKATGERKGSLLMNPGGPGGSGVQLVAGKSRDLGKLDLARDFDLVGWDPRGVGASTPAVKCLSDQQRDDNRMLNLTSDNTPDGIAKQEDFNKNIAKSCEDKMGKKFLQNVGTIDTVRDLDVLRAVLGDEKLTYLGYSYGTFIGAIYAETFPDKVRALVLDGAVDPSQESAKSSVEQMAGFQTVFDDFAKDCATRPDCPLGPDPAQATATYQQLVRPLIDAPVRGQGRRMLSYSDATTATIQGMYAQQLWEPLRTGLTNLKRGDGALLQRMADLYLSRDPSGKYSPMMDANRAINCVDGPAVTDPAELGKLDTDLRRVAPFLDDGRGTGRAAKDSCAFWPAAPTLKPHEVKALGAPKLVVVSTTHDPATPYQNGVNLAKQLDASLISYEGSQHTVSLEGNPCVDGAVTAYLRDLTVPPADLKCAPQK